MLQSYEKLLMVLPAEANLWETNLWLLPLRTSGSSSHPGDDPGVEGVSGSGVASLPFCVKVAVAVLPEEVNVKVAVLLEVEVFSV